MMTTDSEIDEIVRRAARALFDEENSARDVTYDMFHDAYNNEYVEISRTVLEAAGYERLREALTKCRDKFAEYAELHRAKFCDGMEHHEWRAVNDKVVRNQEMVELCDAALSLPEEVERGS